MLQVLLYAILCNSFSFGAHIKQVREHRTHSCTLTLAEVEEREREMAKAPDLNGSYCQIGSGSEEVKERGKVEKAGGEVVWRPTVCSSRQGK